MTDAMYHEILDEYEDIQMENMPQEPTPDKLIAAMRLTRDLKKSSALLTRDQARYLVGTYYDLQERRIAAHAQVRSSEQHPNELIGWTAAMYEQLESDTQLALGAYAKSQIPGQWALSTIGIGPVIAAGLLAHIDITQAPTAGSVWSFAGVNPGVEWLGAKKAANLVDDVLGPGRARDIITDETFVDIAQIVNRRADRLWRLAVTEKGNVTRQSLTAALAKRPYCLDFKVLTWKIGESLMMSSTREESFYGKFYAERKLYEQQLNQQGAYAEQARRILSEKNFRDDTEAKGWYEKGMLPPGHILARAKRYSAKLYLSHQWAVMYEDYYGKVAPRPYIIAIGGHTREIKIPNWPLIIRDRNEEKAAKWAAINKKVSRAVETALEAKRIRQEEKAKTQQEHYAAYQDRIQKEGFTALDWIAMKKAFNHRCAYCGKQFPDEELTRDHVIPRSQGGINKKMNIVPSCFSCNNAKADYLVRPKYFPHDWKFEPEVLAIPE